jgi:hypothetical protein
VSSGPAYSRAYERAPPARPNRAAVAEVQRSNAAIPVVIVLLFLGLYVGQFTLVVPALLGLVLVYVGFSFLSTRLNPLSATFYLTKKPSWLAIGVVWLGALLLFADTYFLFQREFGGVAGHF